jgi:hypothetical protein
MGMETHPSSPRTDLDLMIEQKLATNLKVCRRQLYNWRMAGLIPYFKWVRLSGFVWRTGRQRLRG